MKGIKLKSLCILFLFVFCLVLSSCEIPENILQSSPDVDFSTPQKVQISFNEHIYDTTIVFKDSELDISFINHKDLLNGAHINISSQNYKISYNEMVLEGDTKTLTSSSLPIVVFSFLSSFENGIILDSFDKEGGFHYTKKSVNDCFIVLEAYEKEDNTLIYSMEIK